MLKSRKYFKYTSLRKTFLLYRMTAFIKKTFKNCVPKYELFLNFSTSDSFVIPFHIDKIDFITWNYHSKIKLSVNSFRRIKKFICFSFTNLFSVHFLLFHDISRNSFQRRHGIYSWCRTKLPVRRRNITWDFRYHPFLILGFSSNSK